MWRSFASRSRRSRNARRPELDLLEGRVVLSVAFDSVLGVGNDTASILVRDNTIDSAGNTYATGLLYGTMDLDPAGVRPDGSDILTPRGSSDAFVAKYAPDNTLIWARLMGGDLDTRSLSTFEGGESVAVDGNGNVWAVTFGGTGSEKPAGISVDAAGTIYLTGFYSIPKLESLKTVDFDPDPLGTHELSNAAFTDMFLLKLKRR